MNMRNGLIPVETKSVQTVRSDFFDNLLYWRKVLGDENAPNALVYGGIGRSNVRE